MNAVSDPKSPQYGQYLSKAQIDALTAPSATGVAAVESWLETAGITNYHLSGDSITVDTTVGLVTKLLGVAIQNYQVTYSNGQSEVDMRMAAQPDLPQHVRAVVQSLSGIRSP